ncbi:MAG: TolB family protein [Gemmatimonadales bacterium]
MIRNLLLLLGLPLLAGAFGSAPASSASKVFWPADSGEGHLSNIRQLTFGGSNAEAYFSADGKRLIFQRKDSVEKNIGCDQEYIMNIDGSDLHRISNGEGRTTCGYFVDGDREILYSSTFAYDSACPPVPPDSMGYVWPLGHFEIYSARPDGSDLKPLTSNGAYNAETTASVDGKHLIFTSTRDGDIDLYTMDVDGSNVRRVTNRLGYDGGAYFSPDGKRIVWRAAYPATAADTAEYLRLLHQRLVRPFALEIWTANADGSAARQVTKLGGANWAPYFFPDGHRIIFASNYQHPTSGNFALFLIRDDGTGLEKITASPGQQFDGFPMFSPDGRKLVWVSSRHSKVDGEINVFIADWTD